MRMPVHDALGLTEGADRSSARQDPGAQSSAGRCWSSPACPCIASPTSGSNWLAKMPPVPSWPRKAVSAVRRSAWSPRMCTAHGSRPLRVGASALSPTRTSGSRLRIVPKRCDKVRIVAALRHAVERIGRIAGRGREFEERSMINDISAASAMRTRVAAGRTSGNRPRPRICLALECGRLVQIGPGRLAVDAPLANRVRSGRKQP